MANKLLANVLIFDGSGRKPYRGEVLVQGNRIEKVGKGANKIARGGAEVVDGDGAMLMPGMVNCHSHIGYPDSQGLRDIGEVPPEEHTLNALGNARTVLDHGFTALVSAACAKPRLDIVVRNHINAGRAPGPRMRAASPQLIGTAGNGDARQMHMHHESFGFVCDGPDAMRRTVREMIREGVDVIKISCSGDTLGQWPTGRSGYVTMAEDEVAAAAEVAHSRGKWLAAHARATESIALCLKYGIQIIHHATYVDDRLLDALEKKKAEHWVCPAVGILYVCAHEAQDWDIIGGDVGMVGHVNAEIETAHSTTTAMLKRGIRVLPFGDYGFAFNPHGADARELEHLVNLLGFKPIETLVAATKWGGEAFAMDGPVELGEIKAGYLADLLLVDGDATEDVTLLQDKDNILMIMKDGQYHKPPTRPRAAARRVAAAE
jgi:imidazolonepropionase-like amidohydrolase